LLMELGALFFVLAYLLCRMVWQQWKSWRLWTAQHRRSPEVNLQVMALIGLVGLFAHSWVEFNLRIPANAMLAALLLGLWLRPLPSGEAHVRDRASTASASPAAPLDIIADHKTRGQGFWGRKRLQRWFRRH
jgi:hypothetical protein